MDATNDEVARFLYDWLRSNDSGNGFAAHDGMKEVTLDGTYDLEAAVAAVRKAFE